MNFRIDFLSVREFYGNCIEHIDWFWQYSHLYNLASADPWAWELI
jgi:hypothetical protein